MPQVGGQQVIASQEVFIDRPLCTCLLWNVIGKHLFTHGLLMKSMEPITTHHPPVTERQELWPEGLRVQSPQICLLGTHVLPPAFPCLMEEPATAVRGFAFLSGFQPERAGNEWRHF
jgi:hypothetical protein